MGKQSKRGKKFKKKGGVENIKKRSNEGGRRRPGKKEEQEHAVARIRPRQESGKTLASLPDGVSVDDFLTCKWLLSPSVQVGAAEEGARYKVEERGGGAAGDDVGALMEAVGETQSVPAMTKLVGLLLGGASKKSSKVFEEILDACLDHVCPTLTALLLGDGKSPTDDMEEEEEEEEEQGDGGQEQSNGGFSVRDLATLSSRECSRLTKSEHWAELGPLLYSVLRACLEVLPRHALRISTLFPLLQPFPALSKAYLLELLTLQQQFAVEGKAVSMEPLLHAIRALCLALPLPFLHEAQKAVVVSYEATIKAIYQSARDRSSSGSSSAVAPPPHPSRVAGEQELLMLRKGVALLYSAEPAMAYLGAFVYVGELARVLQEARQHQNNQLHHTQLFISNQSKGAKGSSSGTAEGGDGGEGSRRRALSWRFMQSVWLWCTVAASNKTALAPLLLPLGNMLESMLQLAPGAMRLPYRLSVVRAAHELTEATGVLVSTASCMCAVLEMGFVCARKGELAVEAENGEGGGGGGSAQQHKGKKSKGKGKGFSASALSSSTAAVRSTAELTKAQLHQGAVQDVLVRSAVALLENEASLLRNNPAYPEYMAPVLHTLKGVAAKLDAHGASDATRRGWKASIRALADRVGRSVDQCAKKRTAVKFFPAACPELTALVNTK